MKTPVFLYKSGVQGDILLMDMFSLCYELMSKFNVGIKTPLREAFLNQNFMVTWFTNLKKLIARNDFSFQFRKIITRYKRIGYNQ